MVASTRLSGQQDGPRRATLTDRAIEALKPAPAGKRYIVWDLLMPGLGVRVTDRGTRSFVVVKRRPGAVHPETIVLGKYPAMSLAQARKKSRAILEIISDGKRPSEVKAEVRRLEAQQRSDTFGAAVTSFLDDGALAELRSGSETEAVLRRAFLGQTWQRVKVETAGKTTWAKQWSNGKHPQWRNLPIAEIKRRDVIERLGEIKAEGGKHAARHALSSVRKFFGWCVEREIAGMDVSPCANIKDRMLNITGRDLRRSRVLTAAELRDVWQAADRLTASTRAKVLAKNPAADVSLVIDPAGPLVMLLMLTGQRLNDIAKARWSEIDLEKAVLTVPPERYKTGTAMVVPLSPLALDIIKALPKFGRGSFALTTTGGARPISDISGMKARLNAAIADQREKDRAEPMPPWVLHDLRRTMRTRLTSDLGVDAYIAERCIGHALPGLHAVYDQGSHRDQKRDALDRWATALAKIVGLEPAPEGGDIVPEEEMQRRRKAKRA